MTYAKNNNVQGKTKEVLESVKEINFKERFGVIPKSIMNFKKSVEMMELIDWDNSELGKIEGEAFARGGGFAQNLRYSIYNPDAACFIVDYYTRENDLILDPFMGRATRPLVALSLNRRYVGYDTSSKTVALNKDLISKKFPDKQCLLIHGDGTELNHFPEQDIFDCVFTCPPYYGGEKYSGEQGDLSYLTADEYHNRIGMMFSKLARLIKKSSYKEMKFYPVIITIGSVRWGEEGILDMDYEFQKLARKNGFVLHDKLFTENNTPGAGFTFRRNYCYKFLTKNYETTLVFMKYKE